MKGGGGCYRGGDEGASGGEGGGGGGVNVCHWSQCLGLEREGKRGAYRGESRGSLLLVTS